MTSPRRILVIRRKAIGDVLVSLAVVRALAERWPAAAIDFVVDEAAAGVVSQLGFLRHTLVYPGQRVRSAGPIRTAAMTLEWLRGLRSGNYDVVLDLMGTPQTAVWTWWTGAPVRVGRAKPGRAWAFTHRLPPRGGDRFAGEVFLDAVRVLDLPVRAWQAVPAFEDLEWRGPTSNTIALNPSATWSAKAWPLDHFAALARSLASRGLDVQIAWGPGEESARDRILTASTGTGNRVVAMPKTDLRGLAERLRECALMITTDSGPKHLAVAQGVPTLTLFGSTNPLGWQPPHADHRWLTREVECRPCDLQECPVPGHPCLDLLLPAEVERQALIHLAEIRRRHGIERKDGRHV